MAGSFATPWLALTRRTAAWANGSVYTWQTSQIFRLTWVEQGRRLCSVSSLVKSKQLDTVSHWEDAENDPFLGEVENTSLFIYPKNILNACDPDLSV